MIPGYLGFLFILAVLIKIAVGTPIKSILNMILIFVIGIILIIIECIDEEQSK